MNPRIDRGYGVARRTDLVPAVALEHAPAPVVKANKAAEKAFDTEDKVNGELKTARAESRDADRFDREAMKAAVAADKPEPKPTAQAKAGRVDALERKRKAAIEVRDEKVRELNDTIAKHAEGWKADELAELTKIVDESAPIFEAVADISRRADRRASVVRALHRFNPYSPDQSRTGFDVAGLNGRPEQALAALAAAIREAPASVVEGPSGQEQQTQRAAERQDRKRRRREHLEQRRKEAGTFKWFTTA
jgi:hypothetical protein